MQKYQLLCSDPIQFSSDKSMVMKTADSDRKLERTIGITKQTVQKHLSRGKAKVIQKSPKQRRYQFLELWLVQNNCKVSYILARQTIPLLL